MNATRALASLLFALVPRRRRRAADSAAAQLDTLYAEFWEENLKLNPLTATFAGDPRYNARAAELPRAGVRRADARFRAEISRSRARHRRRAVSRARTASRTTSSRSTASRRSRSSNSPTGCCRSTSSTTSPTRSRSSVRGTSAQPFVTVKDYDDWLKRAARVPAIFDQAIANMREGVKAGIVQPRILMEKVLPQLDANIGRRCREEHLLGTDQATCRRISRPPTASA